MRGVLTLKKYAVCGLSNRAIGMFIQPIIHDFAAENEIVALLDSDSRRFEVSKEVHPEINDVPGYLPDQFDQMIKETSPDAVIVTSRDDTHVDYVLQALKHDLDVVVEKPMTTTTKDAKRIIEAEANSQGKVIVTFNYRYSPIHRKIKELILEGKVGKITSIDLNWYIDTYHGSSYFRRWNRMREYSGGLSIHKSSHHFDLVNWWTGQTPVEAFSFGGLYYYGENGAHNPDKVNGKGNSDQRDCPYDRRWHSRTSSAKVKDDHLGTVEEISPEGNYTNYSPNQNIYDAEIAIEDVYTATVRYDQGALLSYSVNFSTPYEGYRLAINGTEGRIETTEYHSPERTPFPVDQQTIDYYPLFGSKETIHVVHNDGGHGGGDPVLLEDIFLGVDPHRDYEILSGSLEGAQAVATGEAVWRSVKENRPINIQQLLRDDE